MDKIFLRSTGEISLLKKKSDKSMIMLSSFLSSDLMDNKEYWSRCIKEVPNGKLECRKMLEDAKKIIFTKKELIYWFHKIMIDAKTETEIIFLTYTASIGMEVKKIDFERVGYLAGIYEEAERYLKLMTAIEPLDKNKPHYSIIDRLDKLDESYINTDNIPGYYCVQQNLKIKKHKYQIKNLDDYWVKYLDVKDDQLVSEGFGDLKFLLRQYHSEFEFELIKIRPLDNIKEFLDYHLKKYQGDPKDFINHIEYRTMPEVVGFSRSNYPIYQLIIKEWLDTKKNNLTKEERDFLLNEIVSVSATFLDGVSRYKKNPDENKYNMVLRDLLKHSINQKKWSVKDQTMGGSTDSLSKANSSGVSFRDIIITNDKGDHITAIECIRINSIPKDILKDSNIKFHLNKIFRNEPLGLSPLFIIVYCETKSYSETWKKYTNYISKINFEIYDSVECDNNYPTIPPMANLKVAKVKHVRENTDIEVYHIFINMNP